MTEQFFFQKETLMSLLHQKVPSSEQIIESFMHIGNFLDNFVTNYKLFLDQDEQKKQSFECRLKNTIISNEEFQQNMLIKAQMQDHNIQNLNEKINQTFYEKDENQKLNQLKQEEQNEIQDKKIQNLKQNQENQCQNLTSLIENNENKFNLQISEFKQEMITKQNLKSNFLKQFHTDKEFRQQIGDKFDIGVIKQNFKILEQKNDSQQKEFQRDIFELFQKSKEIDLKINDQNLINLSSNKILKLNQKFQIEQEDKNNIFEKELIYIKAHVDPEGFDKRIQKLVSEFLQFNHQTNNSIQQIIDQSKQNFSHLQQKIDLTISENIRKFHEFDKTTKQTITDLKQVNLGLQEQDIKIDQALVNLYEANQVITANKNNFYDKLNEQKDYIMKQIKVIQLANIVNIQKFEEFKNQKQFILKLKSKKQIEDIQKTEQTNETLEQISQHELLKLNKTLYNLNYNKNSINSPSSYQADHDDDNNNKIRKYQYQFSKTKINCQKTVDYTDQEKKKQETFYLHELLNDNSINRSEYTTEFLKSDLQSTITTKKTFLLNNDKNSLNTKNRQNIKNSNLESDLSAKFSKYNNKTIKNNILYGKQQQLFNKEFKNQFGILSSIHNDILNQTKKNDNNDSQDIENQEYLNNQNNSFQNQQMKFQFVNLEELNSDINLTNYNSQYEQSKSEKSKYGTSSAIKRFNTPQQETLKNDKYQYSQQVRSKTPEKQSIQNN